MNRRRAFHIVLSVAAFCLLIAMIATRFIDPALTETQLFLRYGWLYVTGILAVLAIIHRVAKGEG